MRYIYGIYIWFQRGFYFPSDPYAREFSRQSQIEPHYVSNFIQYIAHMGRMMASMAVRTSHILERYELVIARTTRQLQAYFQMIVRSILRWATRYASKTAHRKRLY